MLEWKEQQADKTFVHARMLSGMSTAELGNDASWGFLFFHAISCDVILFLPSMELEREQLGLLVHVVNIVVNAVVVLAVTRTPYLQEPAHTLIANLAVADVGLGVLGVLSPATFVVDRPPMVVCVGHFAVVTCCAFGSVTMLIAINVDRYVSVSRPLRYHQVMTPRVVVVMIALSWSVAVVNGVGSFVGNSWSPDEPCLYDVSSGKATLLLDTVFIAICGVVIVVIYAYMILVARRHRRCIQPLPPPTTSNGSSQPTELPEEIRFFSDALVRNLKLAKTFSIVVGAFFVCWAPYFAVMLLSVFEVRREPLGMLRGVGTVMACCNSSVNFFVYAGQSQTFRTAFRAVLPSRGGN
ncbi:PREDICTED: adrenocorticotropic hormone receptor-like [Priapulus caudatus]|uniref:Adrenocorticotropic hormone receptor-like n=1 Tax=Priapulus caudatus TaxID=37621 RepID=A0ABM1DWJ1_PRICU|nr:PREDICTED: adrenocorticotropic hormone receptor-like [Priapulus caudatus]